MVNAVRPREVHAWLEESLGGRADLGLRKAIANLILEPPSPFDPQAQRKLRTGFLVAALVVTAAVACFAYFSFLS